VDDRQGTTRINLDRDQALQLPGDRWRVANQLTVGVIRLWDNPLLRVATEEDGVIVRSPGALDGWVQDGNHVPSSLASHVAGNPTAARKNQVSRSAD
jgi:hypothetical protein